MTTTWVEQIKKTRQIKLGILIFTLEGLNQKEIGNLLNITVKQIDYYAARLRKEHKTFSMANIALKSLYGIRV